MSVLATGKPIANLIRQSVCMKKFLTISTLIISSVVVNAQNAGNWNLNGSLTGTPGSHLNVSAISLGSSITSNAFNGGGEWYGEGGWTAAGTPDVNGYVQFSVSGASGYYLTLTGVTLIQRRSNTGTPQGSGPTSWALRSSLDNYATNIITGTMTHDYATATISLPAAFSSIPSAVTFRLYGYNATTASGGGISRYVFDNISVQGTAHAGTLAAQSLKLDAAEKEGNIALQWQQEGFSEGTEFSLERADDGLNFKSIYKTQTTMSFTDATA